MKQIAKGIMGILIMSFALQKNSEVLKWELQCREWMKKTDGRRQIQENREPQRIKDHVAFIYVPATRKIENPEKLMRITK